MYPLILHHTLMNVLFFFYYLSNDVPPMSAQIAIVLDRAHMSRKMLVSLVHCGCESKNFFAP